MSAFARAHVLAILRQHGLSTVDAGAIVNEDDRAALGAFLSGRTDNIDIIPLEDLAHALGPTAQPWLDTAGKHLPQQFGQGAKTIAKVIASRQPRSSSVERQFKAIQ